MKMQDLSQHDKKTLHKGLDKIEIYQGDAKNPCSIPYGMTNIPYTLESTDESEKHNYSWSSYFSGYCADIELVHAITLESSNSQIHSLTPYEQLIVDEAVSSVESLTYDALRQTSIPSKTDLKPLIITKKNWLEFIFEYFPDFKKKCDAH